MTSGTDENELKTGDLPPGMLPPIGIPREFLRRQKEEDVPLHNINSMSRNRRDKKKSMLWEDEVGPGGPISPSAIFPHRESEVQSGSLTDTVTPGIESSENEKVWLSSVEESHKKNEIQS
ncbi:putative na+ h+ antiporter [Erysiphe necator]|uniref:Putative na+ h+ antiporter n=1 Tax=Uncinula necator TaxID=52586 RepID=A0A0B1PAV8_UNCNE|nr:putative na+ h+ antiporter [Erysiphe necator]